VFPPRDRRGKNIHFIQKSTAGNAPAPVGALQEYSLPPAILPVSAKGYPGFWIDKTSFTMNIG